MKFNTLCPAFLGASLLAPAALASHTAASSLGTGSGSSINTESAVPLAREGWSVGLRYEQQRSDRLTDAEMEQIVTDDPEADLHSIDQLIVISLDAAYGLTENLTLGLTLPWVERQDVRAPEDDGDGVEIGREGDSKGMGDLKMFGLWRFFQEAATTSHAGLLFGISVPTGKDDDTEAEGGPFEQEFQPGSGSWDPFLGVAYTRGFGRVGLDASLTYTLVNEGSQDTDLGDYLAYNAGLAYALTPDASLRWNAVLELNGLWRDKQEIASETLENSGGSWLELTPGITLSSTKWTAFANVGVPIVNEPNGKQDEHDIRFLLGFRVRR
ncbi:MAG: transporter [Gammaproteobacteria bacterium]|nr:transporter [Gammaproteobacteria bacterium]